MKSSVKPTVDYRKKKDTWSMVWRHWAERDTTERRE